MTDKLRVVYDRETAGRAACFGVRTRILEDASGKRRVIKEAASPEAASHIRRIAQMGTALEELYHPHGILVNRVTLQEEDGTWTLPDGASAGAAARTQTIRAPYLELEYLEGTSVEAALDELLLAKGADAAIAKLQEFVARILPESEMPVCDLDLLPANVLETKEGWAILDYEWTVPYPVPSDFVKYRILHYYREGHSMRQRLLSEDLYARFGLGAEACARFAQMEENLQAAIRGEVENAEAYLFGDAHTWLLEGADGPVHTTRSLRQDMVQEDVATEGSWGGVEVLQVYFSAGEGFREEDAQFFPFVDGKVEAEIAVPSGMRDVRIDPGDKPCVLYLEQLRTDSRDLTGALKTRGVRVGPDTILFPDADPWVWAALSPGEDKTLRFRVRLEHRSHEELQDLVKEAGERKTGRIHGIEGTKGAGFFGHIRQVIRDRMPGKKLLYHIDYGNMTEEQIILRGWAFDPDGEVDIVLTDKGGRELPSEIRRIRRADVEEAMGTVQAAFSGFYICLQKTELPKEGAVLLFTSGRRKRAYLLDPTTDPAFSAEKREDQPADWIDYMEWFLAHRATESTLAAQRETRFAYMPKISIVIPLYNTKIRYLQELLETITGQSYENWELCLADGSTEDAVEEEIRAKYLADPRIRYARLTENTGISGNTNAALAMASGDVILFSDHDDLLEKDALFTIVEAFNAEAQPDIVYTDEDLIDETGNQFYSPRFKCDFNADLICSINYICHLFAVKKEIVDAVGLLDPEMDGAQDWDFILRCAEHTNKIAHVARVLYHWRAAESSTASDPDTKVYAIHAGERAVTNHLRRRGIEATLEYSGIFILFRPLPKVVGAPKVSIIICNKDQRDMLKTCVDSIFQKTTYPDFEIIVVENNSTQEETFAFYREYEATRQNFRVVRFEGAFNYSEVNNYGASFAEGEYLVLLNNDTEVITPDWLTRMVGYCQREDVAAVGAKLYYEDHTIQHCGVVVGMGGFAGHVHTKEPATEAGHLGRLQAVMDVSAVTAACMMVKRSVYREVGGLDPAFQVALNDIDLCLRIRERGYTIVCHPGVELFHYESKTRGYEESAQKRERFKQEIRLFRNRWAKILEEGDPYYSPHLSLIYGDARIRDASESSEIIEEIMYEDALV